MLVSKQYKNTPYERFNKVWLDNKSRSDKLRNLRTWSFNLNSTPNVLNDYLYSLGVLEKKRNESDSLNSYFDSILDDVRKGKYIKPQYKELSYEATEFIEAYNESLELNNGENKETYSKLLRNKIELEDRLKQATYEKEKLNAELLETTQKYQDALKELEVTKTKLKQIGNIING